MKRALRAKHLLATGANIIKATAATVEAPIVQAGAPMGNTNAAKLINHDEAIKHMELSRDKSLSKDSRIAHADSYHAFSQHTKADRIERRNLHRTAADSHFSAGNKSEFDKHEKVLTDEFEANEKTRATAATEPDNIIHCRAAAGVKLSASEPWVPGKPVSYIYAPGGLTTISAGFRKDESITVSIIVDESTAADLQASFDHVTATQKQEPYADEDHEGRKATLRFPSGAVKFTYGEHRGEEGIIVSGAEPTSYGAEAVNGKVYASWSPEFGTDADYASAKCRKGHWTFPDGVRGSASNPARMTCVNFVTGALTNKPAFKNMPNVKAKQAAVPAEGDEPNQDDTVTATWSDAARAAALEARKASASNDDDDSKEAHRLSDVADKTGTQHAHYKAMRAHEAVELKHRRIASDHARSGNMEGYNKHSALASPHYSMAGLHSAAWSGANPPTQATAADESDTVKAAGTSEGVQKSWETRKEHASYLDVSSNGLEKMADHQDELQKLGAKQSVAGQRGASGFNYGRAKIALEHRTTKGGMTKERLKELMDYSESAAEALKHHEESHAMFKGQAHEAAIALSHLHSTKATAAADTAPVVKAADPKPDAVAAQLDIILARRAELMGAIENMTIRVPMAEHREALAKIYARAGVNGN